MFGVASTLWEEEEKPEASFTSFSYNNFSGFFFLYKHSSNNVTKHLIL